MSTLLMQKASCSDHFLPFLACLLNFKAGSRHHLPPTPGVVPLYSFYPPCQVLVWRLSDRGPHHCSQWARLMPHRGTLPQAHLSLSSAGILPLLCSLCPAPSPTPYPPSQQPTDLIKPPGLGFTYPMGGQANCWVQKDKHRNFIYTYFISHLFSFLFVSIFYILS